jgi:hypothetical protein
MAAEDNLSHELFFDAHRGMKIHSGNNFKINHKELGMHWSADPEIATLFSNAPSTPELGRVVSAKIPVSSVETNSQRLHDRMVDPHPESTEKEIPVKKGASVFVTGLTKFREDTSDGVPRNFEKKLKSRTRTYNPPREMKA